MSDDDKARAIATTVVGAIIYALNSDTLPPEYALQRAEMFVGAAEAKFGSLNTLLGE